MVIPESFLDEIHKIAVSTKELHTAAKRIGWTQLSGLKGLVDMVKSPKDFAAGFMQMGMARAARGGVTAPFSPVMSTWTKPQQMALLRAAGSIRAPFKSGQIISYGPRLVGKSLGAKTRAGRKAVHDVSVLHEQFERGTKPRDVDIRYLAHRGHNSPSVIMKEHNLISRLTGEGSEEAKESFRKLRGPKEYQGLREAFGAVYGDRATQFLEPGQKIPKAMRKDFLRKVRENRNS